MQWRKWSFNSLCATIWGEVTAQQIRHWFFISNPCCRVQKKSTACVMQALIHRRYDMILLWGALGADICLELSLEQSEMADQTQSGWLRCKGSLQLLLHFHLLKSSSASGTVSWDPAQWIYTSYTNVLTLLYKLQGLSFRRLPPPWPLKLIKNVLLSRPNQVSKGMWRGFSVAASHLGNSHDVWVSWTILPSFVFLLHWHI